MRPAVVLLRLSSRFRSALICDMAACTESLVPPSLFARTFSTGLTGKPPAGKLVERVGPLQEYEKMAAQKLLQFDPQQHETAKSLDDLLVELRSYQEKMEAHHKAFRRWQAERDLKRQQLLRSEAEIAARRRLERKADDGVLRRWLKRKVRRTEPEPGAGRLVAHLKREKLLDESVGLQPEPPSPPRGIYLYGTVGCGKTMLMDLLFRAADGIVQHRRRFHFHAAMLEVHELMHRLGKQRFQNEAALDASSQSNSVSSSVTLEKAVDEWLEDEKRFQMEQNSEMRIFDAVADKLLGSVQICGASLLCFDEVQVVDVFTAVALSGILGRLLRKGAVLVATSNRAPWELNKEGLQKEIFNSFVAELQQYCYPLNVGLDRDFRRIVASRPHERIKQTHYLWPLNQRSKTELDNKWKEITTPLIEQSGCVVTSSVIPVMFGRALEVPESCCGVCRFTFDQLCDQPVGAADYIALAKHYHTVFVSDIPVMSMRIRDKARRFITLVDELYNNRCRLISTAAAPIEDLFTGNQDEPLIDLESLQFETEAEGSRLRTDVLKSGSVSPVAVTMQDRASIRFILSGQEEVFAFHRAVSRLIEMQTATYLRIPCCHPVYQEVQALPTEKPVLDSGDRSQTL